MGYPIGTVRPPSPILGTPITFAFKSHFACKTHLHIFITKLDFYSDKNVYNVKFYFKLFQLFYFEKVSAFLHYKFISTNSQEDLYFIPYIMFY